MIDDRLVRHEVIRYLIGAISLEGFRDATVALGLSEKEAGEGERNALLAEINALYFEHLSGDLSERDLKKILSEAFSSSTPSRATVRLDPPAEIAGSNTYAPLYA